MSHPSANPRLALKLFAVHLAVSVFVYVAAEGAPGQHWSARTLASLLAADGICDVGLAAYLRFVRRRPRRNEALFLVTALATAAAGWFAVRNALSLALVAGVAVGIIVVQRWLKPYIFDAWWAAEGGPSAGNFVQLRADDPGLAAAKAQAVATIPEFLRRLSAPGADVTSAAVKAPLPVPGGTEHVWLSGIRCEGNEFVGMVANHPSPETGTVLGTTVRVRHSEISDWKIVERGQLVGGFTIRYFLSRMPPAQRAALNADVPFTIGPEPIPRAT